MQESDVFQLFGKDASRVKNAFLAKDTTCHNKEHLLEEVALLDESKVLSNVLVEFKMKNGPLRSKDSRTNFFFCTEPNSVEFSRMVEIPEGKDVKAIYFMIPLLILCLCMSATFSGLNLAIMSFSINDLKLIQESDTEKKNRQRAGDVLRLRRQSNFVLVTIIFGNCFCNTSITILMNYFGEVYGFGDYGYVEFSSSGLLLVFTEILPSLICTKNALAIASKMQYFVIFSMIVTLPISFPLSKLLDRILGKEDVDEDAPLDLDTTQLEGLRGEGISDGNNFNEMMNVVQKTLELRKKRAEDVMTPIEKVGMISEDQPITQSFLVKAYEKGHSRLPVYEKENRNKICGVLNIKDMMLLMDDEGRGIDTDLTAGTMLSVLEKRRKHCFVLNSLPVQQFMSELQQGCTMAIVVEYSGSGSDEEVEESYRVIGIITLEDYIEEIVGEIFDEKDKKGGE